MKSCNLFTHIWKHIFANSCFFNYFPFILPVREKIYIFLNIIFIIKVRVNGRTLTICSKVGWGVVCIHQILDIKTPIISTYLYTCIYAYSSTDLLKIWLKVNEILGYLPLPTFMSICNITRRRYISHRAQNLNSYLHVRACLFFFISSFSKSKWYMYFLYSLNFFYEKDFTFTWYFDIIHWFFFLNWLKKWLKVIPWDCHLIIPESYKLIQNITVW